MQHEKRFLELFGLNCYGCCEPLHDRIDLLLKHVPRLRSVAVSPWADVAKSADQLGRRAVLSWRPNPAMLAGERWDADAVRKELADGCARARSNAVGIILKDLRTVRQQPQHLHEWIRIAQEAAMDAA